MLILICSLACLKKNHLTDEISLEKNKYVHVYYNQFNCIFFISLWVLILIDTKYFIPDSFEEDLQVTHSM